MSETRQKWIINYIPTEGERFTGELVVNNDGVKFETIYESSNKTIVKAIFADVGSFVAAGGHTIYRYSNDEKASVDLPVSDIASVKATKKGMMKQAVITMINDEEFVFDYGLLNVKHLVAAVELLIQNKTVTSS